MVELLFIVCLVGSPTDCREQSLVFTDITPHQCLMGAQPALAKWMQSNGNMRIKSWLCRNVSFAERKA